MRDRVSRLEPNAFDSRVAMSAEMSVRPLTSPESGWRVTRRPLAAPGHAQAERFEALPPDDPPGCGGLCMDIGVLHSWPPQTGSPDTERCTASRNIRRRQSTCTGARNM